MINRLIELLAPAKNLEYGKVAIRYGADAVYIAGDAFGARSAAANSIQDIDMLCQYAHQFSAKIYATMNTIIYENELESARQLAIDLYNAGVDAIIIQDMAFLQMNLPPVQLFASTQAHNYEIEKMNFLESCGISRFILARELNLEQIGAISKAVDAELEFFVHGALCVSFSGKCNISHFETKRSANRGECSQLCRLKYDLLDQSGKTIIKNKHLLSTKDLNLSDYLGRLLNAGISSFKIEGRLKDLNYVKNITAYYRQKLDLIFEANDQFQKQSIGRHSFNFEPKPERSFNRGFTNYFIDGRTDSVVNTDSPKSMGQFIGQVISSENNCIILDSKEAIIAGDGLCYFDGNALDGFFVNSISDGKISPNRELRIAKGTKIYRNQDLAFDRLLSQDKSERKIPIHFNVSANDEQSIRIICNDNIGNQAETTINFPPNDENAKIINDMLIEQLSKTGGTIFTADSIVVETDIVCNLQKSVINSARRNLLDDMIINIVKNYSRDERNTAKASICSPKKTLDYSDNVSNSMAEKFYEKFGAKTKQYAFELIDDTQGLVLMTTKHCLKHDIGDCPRKAKVLQTKNAEPMRLKNGTKSYRLEFNCADCIMKVIAEGKH